MDVGAAINAYKTIWSHQEEYKNIMIHLGCFNFLKENFQVILTIVYTVVLYFITSNENEANVREINYNEHEHMFRNRFYKSLTRNIYENVTNKHLFTVSNPLFSFHKQK